MEGYSDIPRKEVHYTRSKGDITSTAVAVVEYGVVTVSEELFDQMMLDLGFEKEVQ